MREIKFRAWRKIDKKMGKVTSLTFNGTTGQLRGGYSNIHRFFSVKECELMQYTGKKDKNGVEIYEGDIVLVPDEYKDRILDDGSGPTEPSNHLAPVEFDGGSFGIRITNGAEIYSKGFWAFPLCEREIGDYSKEYEVIGNVHENPELIRGVQ